MKSNRARLFVVCTVLFSSPLLASKVITKSPSKVVEAAHLLLTLEVVDEKKETADCSITKTFRVKPIQIHHGTPVANAKGYDYTTWDYTQYTPKGPYAHCLRVSYAKPPRATRLTPGSKVLATAVFDDKKKRYIISGTYDSSRLNELKSYLP